MTDATSRAAALLGPVGSAARAVWCAAWSNALGRRPSERALIALCGLLDFHRIAQPFGDREYEEQLSAACWDLMRDGAPAAESAGASDELTDLRASVEGANRNAREAIEQRDTARAELASAVAERDLERSRLAACGVVARGGSVLGVRSDCESDSLDAVNELARDRYEARAELARVRERLEGLAGVARDVAEAFEHGEPRVFDARNVTLLRQDWERLQAAHGALKHAADAVLGAGAQASGAREHAAALANVARHTERQRRLAVPETQRISCVDCNGRGYYFEDSEEYKCGPCDGYGWHVPADTGEGANESFAETLAKARHAISLVGTGKIREDGNDG